MRTKALKKKGLFIKKYQDDIEFEYEKALALYALGNSHGFICPKPISVDKKKSLVEFEFLTNLVSIREYYVQLLKGQDDSDGKMDVMRQVGVTLAKIHKYLDLKRKDAWTPSRRLVRIMKDLDLSKCLEEEATGKVCVHCDYGFSNVYAVQNGPEQGDFKIAVIDASYDNVLTFSSATFGSPYLDISHMIACLWGFIPLYSHWKVNWKRIGTVVASFIDGYESERDYVINKEKALAYATVYAHAKIYKRYNFIPIRYVAKKIYFNKLYGEKIL